MVGRYSARDPVPEKPDPGVILHQPLSLTIFRFLGLFWPKNERDSCIPPAQKRRTPLPGAPAVTKFGPIFGLISWLLGCGYWPVHPCLSSTPNSQPPNCFSPSPSQHLLARYILSPSIIHHQLNSQ